MIKFLMFILIVIVIPFLVGFLVEYFTGDGDTAFNVLGVLFVSLLFTWFIVNIAVGSNIKTESYVSGTYHLSSLAKNNYIKTTTGKTSVSNSTEERYDYFINNNGEFHSYWVNSDDASLKIKDGALDLDVIKERYTPSFMTKYVIPEAFFISNKSSYVFYVDPKYAQENLGIQVGK